MITFGVTFGQVWVAISVRFQVRCEDDFWLGLRIDLSHVGWVRGDGFDYIFNHFLPIIFNDIVYSVLFSFST